MISMEDHVNHVKLTLKLKFEIFMKRMCTRIVMLYNVLVYECVLVQMLSARSGVLSFNRLSTMYR